MLLPVGIANETNFSRVKVLLIIKLIRFIVQDVKKFINHE
jgi:hypothetical protein